VPQAFYAGDGCADASLLEPQGLGGWVSHSSAEGLLEGSEMEHQRTERIPFGSNGVGFDEKGFGGQVLNYQFFLTILRMKAD
jgi:hypothetical protein